MKSVPRTGPHGSASPYLTWEPVSGFEPLTCRLQEVRPHAISALAAQMTQVIALMALAALGLSRGPVHEPVHANGRRQPVTVTERNGRNPSQRHLNLTTRSSRIGHRLVHRIAELGHIWKTRRLRCAPPRPGVSAGSALAARRRTPGQHTQQTPCCQLADPSLLPHSVCSDR